MSIEFEYLFDDKKGDATISLSKGTLSESQQNVLKNQIAKRQNQLISQFLDNQDKPQYFRPESPIPGLPENIAFKYSYRQSPSALRSVVFNMSWEEATPQLIQESFPEREKEVRPPPIETLPSSKAKVNEEPKQQDWTTLFIEDLNKHLSSLPTSSSDGTERTALSHAVAELPQFLIDKKDASLLLFTAYLHLRAAHFWQIDRQKADFFLLAARPLEVKTNIQTVPIETEDRTQKVKGTQTKDSFDEGENPLIGIIRRFF